MARTTNKLYRRYAKHKVQQGPSAVFTPLFLGYFEGYEVSVSVDLDQAGRDALKERWIELMKKKI